MHFFKDMFGNHYQDFMTHFKASLSPKLNREMVFKAGEGAGRSGSFFFFSHDRKLIIKSMSSEELRVFLERLPAFRDHYQQNQNSMLAKIFGVFTVNTRYMKKVHVMLMENTIQLKNANLMTHIFDLKGSSFQRLVKGDNLSPSTTLKDENWLQFNGPNRAAVKFSKEDKARLVKAVTVDIQFLMS